MGCHSRAGRLRIAASSLVLSTTGQGGPPSLLKIDITPGTFWTSWSIFPLHILGALSGSAVPENRVVQFLFAICVQLDLLNWYYPDSILIAIESVELVSP